MKLVVTALVVLCVVQALAQEPQLQENPAEQQDELTLKQDLLGALLISKALYDDVVELKNKLPQTVDLENEELQNTQMSDNYQPEHVRKRRGLKKWRNKFQGIKRKVDKFLGPRGSPKRQQITALAASFFG